MMTAESRTAAQRRLRALLVLAGACCGAAWGLVGMTLLADDTSRVLLVLEGQRGRGDDLLVPVLLVVSLPLGSLLGSPALDRLSRALGRRPCVMAAAWLLVVGSLLVFPDLVLLRVAGIVVVGLGTGGFAVVLPKIAHELAARGHRRLMPRAWATAPAGAGCALVGGALSVLASSAPSGSDARAGAGVIGAGVALAVLAIVVLLLAVTLPETPHWYVAQGRLEDAYAALRRMHGTFEAAVGIDWVVLDAGTRGDQAALSRSDLMIGRVRQTVLAGLLLELVQALPLGVAALALAPVLLSSLTPAGPLAGAAAEYGGLALAVVWIGVGVCGLARRHAHRLSYSWILLGTGVSSCGVILMALTRVLSGVGDVVVLVLASSFMVAGHFVAVVPACVGGIDPLVPPWLLRSQRRAVAAIRPLVQMGSVGGALLLVALAPSVETVVGVVLSAQVLSMVLALLALPRVLAVLR